MPLPKRSETRYRFQPFSHRLCCSREMTLIRPFDLFTHTKEFWKRFFEATEPPSALELSNSSTRLPAISHHRPLTFISPLSFSGVASLSVRAGTLRAPRVETRSRFSFNGL